MGLIIYSNSIPYITYDEFAIRILLVYKEDREEHRFDGMLGYNLSGRRRVTLYSLDHKPLKIILKPGDRKDFISLLTKEGIKQSKDRVSG